MAKSYSLFYKLKLIFGYSIAAIVIIVALAVSGVRFFLTTANVYQIEVEQFASSILKQPVKIGQLDAKLSGLTPTLIFNDVQLISKNTQKSLFTLSRIEVGISFEDLLLEQKITPIQLTVRGMNLYITRTVEGSYKVKGVDLGSLNKVGDDESNSVIEQLLSQQSELAIEDSKITWKDNQKAGLTWIFNDVSLLLKNNESRHQLLLSSRLPHVFGERIKLSLDLEGDLEQPKTWKIKSYVESKNISLKPIQKYIKNNDFELMKGKADIKLWGDWESNKTGQFSGDVSLYDFTYKRKNKKNVTLKYLSGVFDSTQDKNMQWNVAVDNFVYKSKNTILKKSDFSLGVKYENNSLQYVHINAQRIKLESIAKIVTENHFVSPVNENRIRNLKLNGNVSDLNVSLQKGKLINLQAKFNELGIKSWQSFPRIKNLSGYIDYNNNKGEVEVASKDVTLGFLNIFRESFALKTLDSKVLFSNVDNALIFDVNYLIAKTDDEVFETSATLFIPKDNSSPYLDLQTYIIEGNVNNVSHFLPVSIMEESLVYWIDNALIKGKVDDASIVFSGLLNDFPFDNKEGKFDVIAETSNVTLHYQDGWPKIQNAKSKNSFTGQGLNIELQQGKIENSFLFDSNAQILDFNNSDLNIEVNTKGKLIESLSYLVNSPIIPDAKKTVKSMVWSGAARNEIKINIPLSDELIKEKQISYSGKSNVKNASVSMLQNKINVTDIYGDIFYSDKSFSSESLHGKILGEDAYLTVTSNKDNNIINFNADSIFTPGKTLGDFEIPGAAKITGKTWFHSNMAFPQNNAKIKFPTLTITSDLVGVKSSLPEHFFKKESSKHNVVFKTIFTGNDKLRVDIDFIGKASAALELDQSKKKMFLNKGAVSISKKKAVLPRKNILYVDGSIKRITPSKWLKALDLNKTNEPQSFFVRPVVLNLNRLGILTSKKANDKDKISNPKYLPKVEGIINKFHFNKIFVGRVDFKSSKAKYGLHMDELIISSKNMKFFSHGDWIFKNNKHNTKMDITFSSENYGGVLSDFGFDGLIGQGKAKMVGKIRWKGAPSQFSYYNLNGDIQINIEDGSVIKVDAGAGRLLGFFSLSALPRKLFGDFKDSFNEGFNFNTAHGDVRIEDGDAYSDDFEISSSVATITVSGRTGLADQDFDNLVEVVPDVGSSVAGLTALLINLPAGIGLWLMDKLTGEQFDEASSKSYEVTGTWDDPQFEELIED